MFNDNLNILKKLNLKITFKSYKVVNRWYMLLLKLSVCIILTHFYLIILFNSTLPGVNFTLPMFLNKSENWNDQITPKALTTTKKNNSPYMFIKYLYIRIV